MGPVRLAALLAAAATSLVLLLAPAAEAALPFKRCGAFLFACARLQVPLDRTGVTPGRVSLFVKRIRAEQRPRRGALFVLAGGPGQSATRAFEGDGLGVLSPAVQAPRSDRVRPARHRPLRPAALPAAGALQPVPGGPRGGALRRQPRRAPPPLHQPRLGRGHRGAARGARAGPDRALRDLLRREGRARLRAHLSRQRRAAGARLGAGGERPRPALPADARGGAAGAPRALPQRLPLVHR